MVAGAFYPANRGRLAAQVGQLLASAPPRTVDGSLVGLIVPHAGVVYSGPVAASAYSLLDPSRYERVVAIGPGHFSWFEGVVGLPFEGWRTPLGVVGLDRVEADGRIVEDAGPYVQEHCLEVQLPFLQQIGSSLPILPLLFGQVEPEAGADLLETVLLPGDLLLVSSDLSHYLPQAEAQRVDRSTAEAIVRCDIAGITPGSACGQVCIRSVLVLAARRGWRVELLDLATSADTIGSPDRVVGYGAFAILA